MTAVRLHRAIVSVTSLPEALAFYSDVLGLPGSEAPNGFARLRLGDVELLLHERPARPSPTAVALSLMVEDVDAVVTAAVQRAGCEIIDEPADQPWGERLAVLTDPDGHVICLASAVQG